MIGPGYPGTPMEAFAEGFACGQVGIITITIDDGDGNNVVPQTTNGILQIECGDDGFAVYRYLGVYPSFSALSPYVITWEGASATDPGIDTTATRGDLGLGCADRGALGRGSVYGLAHRGGRGCLLRSGGILRCHLHGCHRAGAVSPVRALRAAVRRAVRPHHRPSHL